MDEIDSHDMKYRKEMESGSQRLLKAIHWARKGYNPATSKEPLKLPPDWSDRQQRVIEIKKRAAPRPSNERIREMMERGLKASDIARELKVNRQKIVWAMKAIKLERRPDRQMEMIRTGLWK